MIQKYIDAACKLEEVSDDLEMIFDNIDAERQFEDDIDIKSLFADISTEISGVRKRVKRYIKICQDWSMSDNV